MLPGPLAVIGIFMLGASAGSIVACAKYKATIGEFRRLLQGLVVHDVGPAADNPIVRQIVRTDGDGSSRDTKKEKS